VSGVGSASAQDALVKSHTGEANVCDIALVSGRIGAINHDVVCGLLTECLQDVSSTVLTLHLMFIY
jgi:hypothetical protein